MSRAHGYITVGSFRKVCFVIQLYCGLLVNNLTKQPPKQKSEDDMRMYVGADLIMYTFYSLDEVYKSSEGMPGVPGARGLKVTIWEGSTPLILGTEAAGKDWTSR